MKKEYLYALGGAAGVIILHKFLMPQPSKKEVTDFINKWINSVCEGTPETISNLYATDGVLVGTIAEEIKVGRTAIKTYFDSFTLKQPCGVLDSINIQIRGNVAIADGMYTFSFGDGSDDVVARFSFVLKKVRGGYEILTHHSSAQPA
jgi:uncharacterized protein (TIGR02246 family)